MPRVARATDPKIGRFHVVREIGSGGMASVHLAVARGDGGFEKWVALKLCHPHLARDPMAQRLLLEEARILGRLSHPNVVSVFEVGFHAGAYFFAMEYAAGRSLRQILTRVFEKRGRVPPLVASRIIADAALGLHAAHELKDNRGMPMGIVHRDVSPHNLIVTYEGITKVVDFGVALSNGSPPMREGMSFNGKMAYMSAEQARGDELDRRADVHSLGIILWELVTGRRLFRGKNDLETILNVLDGNVPRPTMLNHACPQSLERIVMKALAARPSERFPTAQDFARALTEMRVRHMDTCAPPDVADWVGTMFPEDTAETRELPHGEATIRRTPRAG